MAARRPRAWRLLAPYRVIRARPHLVSSAIVGLAVFVAAPRDFTPITRALIGWNATLLVFFIAIAWLMSGATHDDMRKRAAALDEGAGVMLLLTTAVAVASFGAIVVELADAQRAYEFDRAIDLGLTVATVVSSWLFLHLTFALHYAHAYYAGLPKAHNGVAPRGGLDFPGTAEPQYLDFLYYAYVMGVACQTADVDTTSPEMRLLTLVHGVVAFFFNTTVLALLINIASQFVK